MRTNEIIAAWVGAALIVIAISTCILVGCINGSNNARDINIVHDRACVHIVDSGLKFACLGGKP